MSKKKMGIQSVVYKLKSLDKAVKKAEELLSEEYTIKVVVHHGLGTRQGNQVALTQSYGEQLIELVMWKYRKEAEFECFGVKDNTEVVELLNLSNETKKYSIRFCDGTWEVPKIPGDMATELFCGHDETGRFIVEVKTQKSIKEIINWYEGQFRDASEGVLDYCEID